MKYFEVKLIFIFLLVITIFSCSTKKNRFFNREYRYKVLKYNVIFNGEEALKKYEKKITKKFNEDFFNILPVYKINTNIEDTDSLLAKAEKKALKGIHRHSMIIGGKERNKYIDRAYLLLGKSLYYQKEYDAAAETFSYAKSNLRGFKEWFQFSIWLEKSNIEQGRYTGTKLLNKMIEGSNVSSRKKKESYKVILDALIKSEKYYTIDTIANKLIGLASNKKERHRYMFILGQVQKIRGDKKKAISTFKKIINENPNDIFLAMSNIYIASSEKKENENYNTLNSSLFYFLNKKNTSEIKHILLYEIADVYHKSNISDSSLVYINKAIEESERRKIDLHTGYCYDLAEEIYFEKSDYLNAINSCSKGLSKLKKYKIKGAPEIKRLKKQRKLLSIITRHIKRYKEKDNILKYALIPKDSLRSIFYDSIKKNMEIENKKKKIENKLIENVGWYFYDTKSISKGIIEFREDWGKRKLIDNWRTEFEEIIDENLSISNVQKSINIDSIINKKIDVLISKVVSNKDTINKLLEERNYDYYSVAILYMYQFKRSDLCIKQLNKLLKFNISKDLKLPAYYFLYKSHLNLNEKENAEIYKRKILEEYPNSKYTLMLNKNNKIIKQKGLNAKELYKEIYYSYKKRDSLKMEELIKKFENNFIENELMVKVSLLNAMRWANNNYKKYKENLKYIMFNYPGTLEAGKAEELVVKLDRFIPKNNILRKVKGITQYVIVKTEIGKHEDILKELNESYSDLETKVLNIQGIEFILIKKFKNYTEAEEKSNLFINELKLFKKNNTFVLSKLDFERLSNSNKLKLYLK